MGQSKYDRTLAQWKVAELDAFIVSAEPWGDGMHGLVNLEILPKIELDTRFLHGPLYGMHLDVGHHLRDYRSLRGSLGKGSMQFVPDVVTGHFYSDVDRFNFYEDVVGAFGHSFLEVMPYWIRAWWNDTSA